MSVFITGGTYGTFNLKKILPKAIKSRSLMQENDTIIITGDFGLIYKNSDFKTEEKYLSLLEKVPVTICFIDGDRDNLNRLLNFETVHFSGAPAKKIRKNIFYLLRGCIYTIDNKKFLCMGGGSTIHKENYIEGKTYWNSENIQKDDYDKAKRYLSAHNNTVDYVVSHVAPYSIFRKMKLDYSEDEVINEKLLDSLLETVTFEKWFFGYFKIDKTINKDFYSLYKKFIKVT